MNGSISDTHFTGSSMSNVSLSHHSAFRKGDCFSNSLYSMESSSVAKKKIKQDTQYELSNGENTVLKLLDPMKKSLYNYQKMRLAPRPIVSPYTKHVIKPLKGSGLSCPKKKKQFDPHYPIYSEIRADPEGRLPPVSPLTNEINKNKIERPKPVPLFEKRRRRRSKIQIKEKINNNSNNTEINNIKKEDGIIFPFKKTKNCKKPPNFYYLISSTYFYIKLIEDEIPNFGVIINKNDEPEDDSFAASNKTEYLTVECELNPFTALEFFEQLDNITLGHYQVKSIDRWSEKAYKDCIIKGIAPVTYKPTNMQNSKIENCHSNSARDTVSLDESTSFSNTYFFNIKREKEKGDDDDKEEDREYNENSEGKNDEDIDISVMFFRSCANGKVEEVQDFLHNYDNININILLSGETPIHMAILNGYVSVVYILVRYNPDLTIKNFKNQTPSELAENIYNKLLTRNENEARIKKYWRIIQILKSTSIFAASREGDLGRVKYLIEDEQISINIQNNNKMTPLHFAVISGNIQLIRYLIINGGDIKNKNNLGQTPIDFCFENPRILSSIAVAVDYVNNNNNKPNKVVEENKVKPLSKDQLLFLSSPTPPTNSKSFYQYAKCLYGSNV